MNRSTIPEHLSSQEHALLQHVERLDRFREGRRAIYVYLSRLRPHLQTELHLRIATDVFEYATKNLQGQRFKLLNNDLVLVCQHPKPEEIDDAIAQINALFQTDPATRQGAMGLCTVYDFERQYRDVVESARTYYAEARKRLRQISPAFENPPEVTKEKPAIDPHRLGELVDAIAKADLSGVMRRQTICALLRDQPPQPLFRELFISLPELGDIILPGYDIGADRWLLRSLTETLDRRMLALLIRRDDPDLDGSFSINLNVATTLSPEFLAFDASLKRNARGSILVEFELADVYADLGKFVFARDFLRGRGYKLCLDKLTEQAMPFIDRHALGFDLIKLQWSPSLIDHAPSEGNGQVQQAIDRAGRANTILCHVDSEDAVAAGKSLGIAMFQGRHIDQLIQAIRRPGLR